ncbi:precorrin-3B synthase [Salinarimonas rosea]|uniref:precorrin-3B synthase n=1 Tax=Salinarimonas rosea TaxID=552063 RepID=UPI0005BE8590|nr:precorrin-3B synthase [Salinarimonas rosea]
MSAPSLRRGWCPGARRPMETGDGLLVRVHPPRGILSAAQARALADAAEACGNGLLDVTARGNLQIRGVSEATHPAVLERLSATGLLEGEAEGPYRLTLVSPLAGIDPAEAFDAAALAAEIEELVGNAASGLPAKFHVAVDGGGALPLEPGADVWIAPAEGGVAIGLAEGDGYAWVAPVPLAEAANRVARAVEGFIRHRGDARRMRNTPPEAAEAIATATARTPSSSFPVGEGGSAKPRRMGRAGRAFGEAEIDGRDGLPPGLPLRGKRRFAPRPIRHAAYGGAPSSPTGKENVSVGPPVPSTRLRGEAEHAFGLDRAAGFIAKGALLLALPFGRATAKQLRAAAGWSVAHGAGELRLSFTRGVLIPHLTPAAADSIIAEARALGFVTDPADPRLALVACPGAPACGRAHSAAPQDALALAEAVRPLADAGARIHVSACPKGCAHPRTADLTLVGRADGRYDVIPGGTAGEAPVAALPLPTIAAILRRTSDPRGLAAAFGDHET